MTDFRFDLAEWQRDSAGVWLRLHVSDLRDAMTICDKAEPGKTYICKVKRYRPKRSLDANALYWSLLHKLAAALKTSAPELHNIMLRRYGQLERYGDRLVYVVLPDTDEAAKQADTAETYHVKPTSEVRQGKDGKIYRTYMLLRGSSTYDTAEMSRLIDGLISECQEVGIDTASERERSLYAG